ncbi:MAG: hypothetical protein ACUVSD_08775 [Thiobacillaceae bacterium]
MQQALLQVLQPLLDPTFSAHSYGFRPGRRAHDAILAAQGYIQAGRRVVVDVDGRHPTGADHCLLRQTRLTPALMTSTSRTARCGPACRVVWEGIGQVS